MKIRYALKATKNLTTEVPISIAQLLLRDGRPYICISSMNLMFWNRYCVSNVRANSHPFRWKHLWYHPISSLIIVASSLNFLSHLNVGGSVSIWWQLLIHLVKLALLQFIKYAPEITITWVASICDTYPTKMTWPFSLQSICISHFLLNLRSLYLPDIYPVPTSRRATDSFDGPLMLPTEEDDWGEDEPISAQSVTQYTLPPKDSDSSSTIMHTGKLDDIEANLSQQSPPVIDISPQYSRCAW